MELKQQAHLYLLIHVEMAKRVLIVVLIEYMTTVPADTEH